MGYSFKFAEDMLSFTDDYHPERKINSVTINGKRFIPEPPPVPAVPFEVGDIVQVAGDAEYEVGPRPGQYGKVSRFYGLVCEVDFGALLEGLTDSWNFCLHGSSKLNYDPSTSLLRKVGRITEEG